MVYTTPFVSFIRLLNKSVLSLNQVPSPVLGAEDTKPEGPTGYDKTDMCDIIVQCDH